MAGTGETSIRSYRFYVRNTNGPAMTTDFKDCQLLFVDKGDGKTNFTSTGIIISNDSNADEIAYSFDGLTVDGELKPQEVMNFFQRRAKVVYLRGSAGAEPYRVTAW